MTNLPVATVLVLALVGSASVVADDWAAPEIREKFSQTREWFVRITPGSSKGTSTADFFRRQADRSYRLVSTCPTDFRIAPVDFLVTDHGYLAAFDNWGQMGIGSTVAIYSPAGKLVRSIALRDFADPKSFTRTASSLIWRGSNVQVRPGQISIHVPLAAKGAALIIETGTGKWQYCEWKDKLYQCRSELEPTSWTAFREPSERFSPAP